MKLIKNISDIELQIFLKNVSKLAGEISFRIKGLESIQ